jgi:hypothetical protein
MSGAGALPLLEIYSPIREVWSGEVIAPRRVLRGRPGLERRPARRPGRRLGLRGAPDAGPGGRALRHPSAAAAARSRRRRACWTRRWPSSATCRPAPRAPAAGAGGRGAGGGAHRPHAQGLGRRPPRRAGPAPGLCGAAARRAARPGSRGTWPAPAEHPDAAIWAASRGGGEAHARVRACRAGSSSPTWRAPAPRGAARRCAAHEARSGHRVRAARGLPAEPALAPGREALRAALPPGTLPTRAAMPRADRGGHCLRRGRAAPVHPRPRPWPGRAREGRWAWPACATGSRASAARFSRGQPREGGGARGGPDLEDRGTPA